MTFDFLGVFGFEDDFD